MVKIIYLLSIFLFQASLSSSFHNFQKKKSLRNRPLNNSAVAFYLAAQTGNKSLLKYKEKKLLKNFGLIHLLTPSGIHLSAILGIFLLLLPRKVHIFIFLGTLLFFLRFPEFHSLKRVLYFQILNFFIKGDQSTKLCFTLTFLIDFITGGFHRSPLSFSFSFLFWGTIIFTESKSFSLIINLFKAQMLAMLVMGGQLHIMSLIINPVITSIYSFFFPLMSFNFWVIEFEWIKEFIIFFHKSILTLVHFINLKMSFLNIGPQSSYYLFIFLFRLKRIIVMTLFLLLPLDLNKNSFSLTAQNYYYPLPKKNELLSHKGNRMEFIDIKCRKKLNDFYWEFKCKKKPSKYGGPSI